MMFKKKLLHEPEAIRMEKAEAAVAAVAPGDIGLAWYHSFRGYLLLGQGNLPAADAAFVAALDIEPGFPPAEAGAADVAAGSFVDVVIIDCGNR